MPDYRRRATREAMSVRLDANGMMAEAIGQTGVTREEVAGLGARLSELAGALKARRTAGDLPKGFEGERAEVAAWLARKRPEYVI